VPPWTRWWGKDALEFYANKSYYGAIRNGEDIDTDYGLYAREALAKLEAK